jgi:cobalt-zinc-cadmium efflux system outer membrane protein
MRASWLFLVLMCGSPAVVAQAPEPPPSSALPLSLDDAIDEARHRHPSLDAARNDAAARAQRSAIAQSLRPPTFDARIWQWPVTTANPTDVNMFMFMAQQEIPGRGKRSLRAEAADEDAALAWAAAGTTEWQVVMEVKQTYAALRAIRREWAATEAEIPTLDDLRQASELAYASARGAQAAVVLVGLERSRLQERLVTLRSDEERALAALNGAIGRPASTPVGTLDAGPPPMILDPVEVLVATAAEAHPALAQRRAEVRWAEAETRAARAEARPDWLIEGGYMLMPGEAGAWSARVGISWPNAPWSRTRVTAATTAAQARRRAAAARVEAQRLELERAVTERAATVRGLQHRLVVIRTATRPQARHLSEATELAYAGGNGTLADVLDARRRLLAVDVDLARVTGALDQAWAALEEVVGRDLTPRSPARVAAGPPPPSRLPLVFPWTPPGVIGPVDGPSPITFVDRLAGEEIPQ